MKKLILILALAVLCMPVLAKENSKKPTVSVEENSKKPSIAGFVSNRFWDNWEIGGAAGIQTALSNGPDLGKLGERLGFIGEFSAVKWLHPVAGLRVQLQGGYFNNYDKTYGSMEWPYVFAHADLMLNCSNWFGGYREDRAYYFVPFVGFGYFASNVSKQSQEMNHSGLSHDFAMTYGIQNRFRLAPVVDFTLEFKGFVLPSRVSPASMGGNLLFGFSATAGFSVRFNQRGWQRGVAGYTSKDIRAFQTAVADGATALDSAKATNAELTKELDAARIATEAAKAEAVAAAARKTGVEKLQSLSPTSVIFYDYGTSKLTGKEKTRLDLVANMIKTGPKDKVYMIEGRADQQTGSAEGNKRVAENRAKSVYDYLVKLGVNAKQLAFEGKGNEANLEGVQKANRAVVIR